MNEPATFGGGEENSLPGNTIHYGGVRHRDIHNAYGFLNVSELFILLIKAEFEMRKMEKTGLENTIYLTYFRA